MVGDAVTESFDLEELLARLRALTRRGHSVSPPHMTVGDLTIDTRARLARRAQRLLPLSAKEFKLLELLARTEGTVVSRSGEAPLIHTRRGTGYLLVEAGKAAAPRPEQEEL